MNSPRRLRSMTATDLEFADRLRDVAGWNQTLPDWERFLATEPEGCFVAEWEGSPAGTATTVVYSPDLAWIGMVLVEPAFRRRGVGRGLLEHCLAYLERRGVACVKLDATPAGKEVYDRLGFTDEWRLARWSADGVRFPSEPWPAGLRPWRETDGSQVEVLDRVAFGVARTRVFPRLARQSRTALVLEREPGRIAAYGMTRPGARACYLGPVVAESPEAGECLVRALLRDCSEPVYWDIPEDNARAIALARSAGFTMQRPLIRMCRGVNRVPGDPTRQFALAGPEWG